MTYWLVPWCTYLRNETLVHRQAWESGAKLVADIMSSLLQMFASSSKQTAADYFSKQLHTENRRQGLGFCRSVAMTIYLTTSAETSASPPTYQILIWER